MMRFIPSELEQTFVYKLLTATVTPRPIAWVSTLSQDGKVNAAPFSFFNVMGSEPPIVALGCSKAQDRPMKDTTKNILETHEFVINLVSEDLLDAMNITAMDAPFGVDELALAGLSPLPSNSIKAPQIAQSPVSFECVLHSALTLDGPQTLIIGLIKEIRIEDAFIKDAERGYIDVEKMNILGRMHGPDKYVRCSDIVVKDRIAYKNWQK